MKIAVTSQNRKTITGHAGKCRKFWVYEIGNGGVSSKHLLELPFEQSFHESHGARHPLDDIDALITQGMGGGLRVRLQQRGIEALITLEIDPDQAVVAYLQGKLETLPPGCGSGHEHGGHQC